MTPNVIHSRLPCFIEKNIVFLHSQFYVDKGRTDKVKQVIRSRFKSYSIRQNKSVKCYYSMIFEINNFTFAKKILFEYNHIHRFL